jgi:hypothetical protein
LLYTGVTYAGYRNILFGIVTLSGRLLLHVRIGGDVYQNSGYNIYGKPLSISVKERSSVCLTGFCFTGTILCKNGKVHGYVTIRKNVTGLR